MRRTTGTTPEPMMSANTCPGPTEGSWLVSVVHGLQSVERDRLFLSAHWKGAERATHHADGKRADALNQRRRCQHAATGVTHASCIRAAVFMELPISAISFLR